MNLLTILTQQENKMHTQDSNKAQAIERRHGKQCVICMLLDVNDKKMIWHLYKEGLYNEGDQYVCDKCVKGIKEIREKCHMKFNNPTHPVFKEFMPWFVSEVPGLKDEFMKQKCA
jgi:hypothetical protein